LARSHPETPTLIGVTEPVGYPGQTQNNTSLSTKAKGTPAAQMTAKTQKAAATEVKKPKSPTPTIPSTSNITAARTPTIPSTSNITAATPDAIGNPSANTSTQSSNNKKYFNNLTFVPEPRKTINQYLNIK
jgi:hypothetical protein